MEATAVEKIRFALKEVQYHRSEIMQMQPLYWPQVEAIKLIEQRIAEKNGGIITIRSSRQTMKNECSAMVQARALTKHYREGGEYIRTAPTWKPQIVTSRKRLERILFNDPLSKGTRPRYGFTFERGPVSIIFLSSDRNAQVVGATASVALDLDEAHKVDAGKFEEDFSPMCAFNNVPVIMWGVAADQNDLLYEYRQKNEKDCPENNLQYPAPIWCEIRPEYAKHFEERVAKLGIDHPVIKTQYLLEDIKALGGFLNEWQIASILSGDHKRRKSPKEGCSYVVLIDIAGEAEEEETDPFKKSFGQRDATVALVVEVDKRKLKNDFPLFRIVDLFWWVGRSLAEGPSQLPGQQATLLKILELWKPFSVVVDARGVGEQMAAYFAGKYGEVNEYKANIQSVSDDCYDTLALANNERIKLFKDDGSDEYQEFVRQLEHTKYQIVQHDKMKLTKPKSNAHIDMVKALTYLSRAMGESEPGIL